MPTLTMFTAVLCVGVAVAGGLDGDSDSSEVVSATTQFGLDLYSQVRTSFENNFVMSAYSLETVLAMVYMGAVGKTKSQMKTLLHLPEDGIFSRGYQTLIQKINQPHKNIALETANSIFIDKEYSFSSQFKSNLTNIFQSKSKKTDFKHPLKAARKINRWVEEKTNNKIKDLVSPNSFSEDTVMILVNAIYFKGKWKKQFDKKLTSKQTFFVNSDESVQVQMMMQTEEFHVKQNENLFADIIELPYANKKMKMYIVLPNEKDGLGSVEEKLENMSVDEFHKLFKMKNSDQKEILLKIPKFRLETTLKLMPILENLGFKKVFEKGNFGEMLRAESKEIRIGDVIQKAFIEVNEEGAEATAATQGRMDSRIIGPLPEQITCDHPFLFFLTCSETGLVFFQGRVINPLG